MNNIDGPEPREHHRRVLVVLRRERLTSTTHALDTACVDPRQPDFDWNDANVDHVAAHGVSPTEAEDAILDTDRLSAPARSTETEKRRGSIGATAAGHILFVSYTIRGGAFRVVTAVDASAAHKRRYRQRMG